MRYLQISCEAKKLQIQNMKNEENDELLIPTMSEIGDNVILVTSPTSDIDKDSLNGDIEECSDNENSCEDDSETENQDAENYLHQSLATLSTEIDVKKRLISELQSKQKQLRKIREHYEQQLHALNNKIKETESERDQVLANLGEVEVTNEERVRKVRMEYEKKLANLKVELNQLQTAKREHTLMLKNQQRKDHELRLLQKELNDLKSLKVQLTKKLREETKRTREVDNVHNKEIVQLRKEKRMADNQIRNLEQEKIRKDLVLKRKQEEVESLRRRQNKFGTDPKLSYKSNAMSLSSSSTTSATASRSITKTPYKITKPHARRNSILARVTKSKLNAIENALKKTIIRRHTMNGFEQDLNTRVREREKLSRKLQLLELNCQQVIKDTNSTDDIFYEMKNLKSQIETLQEEIHECQSNILDIEETKLEESVSDIISKCSLDEAQYLLEQVYQISVNKGILAQTLEAQESTLKFELENKIQEKEQALDMLRIALQHSTVPFDLDGIFADGSDEEYDDIPDETELSHIGNSKFDNTYQDHIPRLDNRKMKRKQATTEELLGVNTISDKSFPNFNLENNNNSLISNFQKTLNSVESINDKFDNNLTVLNAWKDSSNNDINNIVEQRSPQRKQLTWKHPGGSMTTSLIVSKNDIYTENFIQNYNTLETPPSSPSNFRKVSSQRFQAEENVFKRLTNTRPSPNPTRGSITFSSKKNLSVPTIPLQCTHVAEGHHRAVLDIDISENIMITGSKDRSAKIWDLTTFMEIDSLTDHQSSVTKVRYSNNLNIAYTVSTFYIKMWDLRDSKKCIRTLWSSGLSQEGPPEFSQASRQTICPPGENFIMDMTFSGNENIMFLATANSVKVWDMRRFCAVGKLHGNHQAPVMVLASCDKDRISTTLVTGSKDHYIKVFDVAPSSVGLITPSIDLQPPHYDGVESLSLRENILLSGSRDACIKKWDLSNGLAVASLSQAHRDWIQALCFTSDGKNFVSGCRSGVIKLWNTDNCGYIGDVQAHQSSINAIKLSCDKIFSASSDGKVKIWQMTNFEQ